MLNECLDLINTKIDVKVEDKSLTENLKVWRKDRNITKADYLVFVGNVLEELLEPIYNNEDIEDIKSQILVDYFDKKDVHSENIKAYDIIDAIQDIQVFCINETELMCYDNLKCNNEVFKEINSRVQDPQQKEDWIENGANSKWQKMRNQPQETLYIADYSKCKL